MAIASLLQLGGCSAYLHSPDLETKTADIKTSFAALKAPAFLEAERTRADEFAAREDAAVAALAASARNVAVVDFVRPLPSSGVAADSAQKLLRRVEQDLGEVYRPAPWDSEALDRLGDARRLTSTQMQLAAQADSELAVVRADYIKARQQDDKRPTECVSVPLPPAPAAVATDTSAADLAYIMLQAACQAKRAAADAPLAFLDLPNTQGELGAALKAYQGAQAKKAADEAAGKKLKAEIAELSKAKDDLGVDDLGTALTQAHKLLDRLKDAEPYTRLIGLEGVAATLEPALAATLDPKTAVPDASSEEIKALAAVLILVHAADTTARGLATAPANDRGDALLIAVADLKHQQAMAALDVAWEERRIRLLQGQVAALLLQAEQLVRAHRLLSSTTATVPDGFADLREMKGAADKARLAEALTAYVQAWDIGRTPYWVLRFREVQYRRMAALDRARQTEADTRALLAPSIDTLAASGAGGIKPEVWATLLGDLLIAGAIVGK